MVVYLNELQKYRLTNLRMELPRPDERLLAQGILAAILLFSIFTIAIPFSQSSLQSLDLPGHFQAAAYIHDVLWPSPIGWDYRFFGGYPLNQFYSPLFAWLVALGAFAVPLATAFKALLILATLATPFTAYYAARKWSLHPLSSSVLAVMVSALLYTRHGDILGIDFYSVFHWGFVGMGLSTPLLFLYIGRLRQDVQAGSYILSSILLVAVTLAHVIIGLAAWVFLASYVLASDHRFLGHFGKHAALSALLIAFWAIPFAAKVDYLSPEAAWSGAPGIPQLAVLALTIPFAAYIWKRRDRDLKPLITYFSILTAVFLAQFAADPNSLLSRFFLVALAVGLVFPLRSLELAKKTRYLAIPVVLSAVLLFLAATSTISDLARTDELVSLPDFGPVDGRIAVAYRLPLWHPLSEIIPATTGNLVARGFYTTSATNSEFYRHIMYEFENLTSRDGIEKHLRHFGVAWLLADHTMGLNYTEERYITYIYDGNISLFRISNTTLAETLDYVPGTVNGKWKPASWQWFNGTGANETRIVVYSQEPLPDITGTGQEAVELTEVDQDSIRVRVNATSPVPIFLKFSHFPNWKAYVNGEPTEIYRVLPALMLVYGHGDIELRYEQLPVDIAGWLLSAFGLLWAVILLVRFDLRRFSRAKQN